MSIAQNIAELRQRVRVACTNAGRAEANVTIVAVSKTRPAGDIIEAYKCGITDFGENRVDELVRKRESVEREHPDVATAIRWHFIGHLQSKKCKDVLMSADTIDSVDSLRLARVLDKRAVEKEKQLDVLLQVHISGEDQKYGIHEVELQSVVDEVRELPRLAVRGLMGMASFTNDADVILRQFGSLQRLFRGLADAPPGSELTTLSMGMSGDFELAIAMGATEIRVGSLIFGSRG